LAQLIKLQDYISRYQVDAKRYPTQYIRLKKSKWDRLKEDWENPVEFEEQWEDDELIINERKTLFQKLNPFKRKEKELEFEIEEMEEEVQDEDPQSDFHPQLLYRPKTVEELRRMYMDQLFSFQLSWASTTMREKSNIDSKYYRSALLKELLTKLPDTFFVMYEPIFLIKKAPVEMGVVIITPTECYCIQNIEAEERATFTGINSDRFWEKRIGDQMSRVVNPMISLNRMEMIIKGLFEQNDVAMKIQKVVLSRNGYIDYPGSSYGVEFIDRRQYDRWMDQLKNHHSPMKHMQFKVTETFLNNVQTTSFMRAEWFTEEGE